MAKPKLTPPTGLAAQSSWIIEKYDPEPGTNLVALALALGVRVDWVRDRLRYPVLEPEILQAHKAGKLSDAHVIKIIRASSHKQRIELFCRYVKA
jgi:hypothetical protein